MNKVFTWFIFIFLLTPGLFGQDFLGINTGNYSGVTGLMLQPAGIVDSRYKFDINLFSFGTNFNNNYLKIDRRALTKFDSKHFNSYQTFKEKYLSETSFDSSGRVWFDVNTRVQLPLSFMATINNKSAIALSVQNRSMVQARNIRPVFARMAYNEFFYPALNNQVIDASGFSLNSLNWVDIGFTYGRVIYASEKHFVKAAVTAKYLAGTAGLRIASNDLRFSVNNDSSINFSTSRFEYARNSKADFDLFDRDFSPDAKAFGLDAGIVYEYRGSINRLVRLNNTDPSYEEKRRDVNKYIFKVGVSLMDVGVFKFDKAATVNNVGGNVMNWQLINAGFKNVGEFDTALNNRTQILPDNPRQYKIHLPTALSVQADVKLYRGFYLNAMAYRPVQLNSSEGYRFDDYGYYAITPRFESRYFGIYLPYTFTNHKNVIDYKRNLLGISLRLGPLFIGSSNLGTMLFNKQLLAADVHAGIKVGITYGKPSKAGKFIERLTGIAKDTVAVKADRDSTVATKDAKPAIAVVRDTASANEELPLIIDYKNGKIYGRPNVSGNIIVVNNNNIYYNSNGKDSLISQRMLVRKDSVIYLDSSQQTRTRRDTIRIVSDTILYQQKLLQDSLRIKKAQLDSLIKRLQKLRDELDGKSGLNINKTQQVSDTKNTNRFTPLQDDSVAISGATDINLTDSLSRDAVNAVAGNSSPVIKKNCSGQYPGAGHEYRKCQGRTRPVNSPNTIC